MGIFAELLKAVFYGVVEGITEWLPVSSTGHLILLGDAIPFSFSEDAVLLSEFRELFDVVIQLGAIFAVALLYRKRLFPRGGEREERRGCVLLWERIVIACFPAAIAGIVLDKALEHFTGKDLDAWLFRPTVVAVTLIGYGIAFLLIERKNRKNAPRVRDLTQLNRRTALAIGGFQALSIVPGTSRSGATVLGAMLLGLDRTTGAEFSFFLALPVMAGAGGIKSVGFWKYVSSTGTKVPAMSWGCLAVGCAVSFAVSLVTIRFLLDFVKRHSFAPFGLYRIALGIAVLIRAL